MSNKEHYSDKYNGLRFTGYDPWNTFLSINGFKNLRNNSLIFFFYLAIYDKHSELPNTWLGEASFRQYLNIDEIFVNSVNETRI